MITFDETPPSAADWRHRSDTLRAARMPFLVVEVGGEAVVADTGNDASAALHRRYGFTEVGRLRSVGFKHDRWVDTVLFQRDLTTPDAPAGG